jgi:hypothetical protein
MHRVSLLLVLMGVLACDETTPPPSSPCNPSHKLRHGSAGPRGSRRIDQL